MHLKIMRQVSKNVGGVEKLLDGFLGIGTLLRQIASMCPLDNREKW